MAFISVFSGLQLSVGSKINRGATTTIRSKIGDSVAPKISITDNKNDTSSVAIDWQRVDPPLSLAPIVAGNAAFAATLAGRKDSTNLLTSKQSQSVPQGISPADFYFPAVTRNIAPVVNFSNSFESDARIDVSFDVINQTVSGISSNAPDSIAFWKSSSNKKQFSTPPSDGYKSQGSDPISTALFEKYIPSSRRNKAPLIQLKKPAFDGDESAYCFVETEYVSLDPSPVQKLSVTIPEFDEEN